MKISDKDFYLLWDEALAASDRDTYISDWALSSIWGDEPESEIPQSRIDWLGRLWDVAHMSVRDIAQAAGLRQVDVKYRFCTPLRTVQSWWSGERDCPNYHRLMMAEALGLISRERPR